MMPIAVATSASPTSLIRPAVTLPAASFSSANARMMPMTVPSRPMNGALAPSVPRNASRRSIRIFATCVAPAIRSSAEAAPSSGLARPAAATCASTDLRRRQPLARRIDVADAQEREQRRA